MGANVDVVHLVAIGDTRWWSVAKPETEMQPGCYVHHSAYDRLREELDRVRASLSKQVPLAEFDKWQDRAIAAEREVTLFRDLLVECQEMSDNWPGIAYTADLQARMDAAINGEEISDG